MFNEDSFSLADICDWCSGQTFWICGALLDQASEHQQTVSFAMPTTWSDSQSWWQSWGSADWSWSGSGDWSWSGSDWRGGGGLPPHTDTGKGKGQQQGTGKGKGNAQEQGTGKGKGATAEAAGGTGKGKGHLAGGQAFALTACKMPLALASAPCRLGSCPFALASALLLGISLALASALLLPLALACVRTRQGGAGSICPNTMLRSMPAAACPRRRSLRLFPTRCRSRGHIHSRSWAKSSCIMAERRRRTRIQSALSWVAQQPVERRCGNMRVYVPLEDHPEGEEARPRWRRAVVLRVLAGSEGACAGEGARGDVAALARDHPVVGWPGHRRRSPHCRVLAVAGWPGHKSGHGPQWTGCRCSGPRRRVPDPGRSEHRGLGGSAQVEQSSLLEELQWQAEASLEVCQ